MSLVFTYGSRQGTFTPVDLGTQAVRLGAFQVTMAASMGDVASSHLPIDDLTGTAGHSGDQILGDHTMDITEDACTAGNQVIFSGYTRDRTYASADSLITGAAVRIGIDLADVNEVTQFFLLFTLPEINRPAETVGARLTWLISSTFSGFVDSGLVVYPTTLMDATDYTNQTVASVLDDCAQTVGYNWFIRKASESATSPDLAFFDPNTSTLYSSSLRISNVLADIDSTVAGGVGATQTWGPLAEPTLKRSPQNLASTIIMPWSGGTYTGSRNATSDIYGFIDITAADSNVKSASAAKTRVDRLLWQDSTEEDVINVSLQLPAAHVNDVREGQRMQAKFRQLPGYKSSYSWFRVMYRTVSQQALTDQFYTVDLTLSPQEAAQPAGTIVQSGFAYLAAGGGTLTLPNPITIGNLLVVTADRWKANGVHPVAPYTGSGAIGGTAAWTQVDTYVQTASSGDRSELAMWKKVANGTNNSGPMFSAFTWAAIYEISGTTTSSSVSADRPGAGAVMNAGSLGSPPTGSIGIYVAAQYSPDVGPMSFTPSAGWVVDSEYTSIFWSKSRPYWVGHLIGTGVARSASITSSITYPWCGIGAVFAP